MNRGRRTTFCVLLSSCSLVAVGCNREVTGQVAEVSAAYLGNVISVLTTGYLLEAWGVETTDEHAHEDTHSEDDGHSHDAEPLHEHEH